MFDCTDGHIQNYGALVHTDWNFERNLLFILCERRKEGLKYQEFLELINEPLAIKGG